MSDPSAPQNPKSRRSRGRVPETIDLPATEVVEEKASDSAAGVTNVPDASEQTPQPLESQADKAGDTPIPDIVPEVAVKGPEGEQPPNPQTESEMPEPKAPKKSASGGKIAVTGIVAGLIGGLAGAALMAALQPQQQALPSGIDSRLAAVESRLQSPATNPEATLSPRIAAVETAAREAGTRLSNLEGQQKTLQTNTTTLNARIDTLAARETAISGQQGAASSVINKHVAALDQRLSQTAGNVQSALNAAAQRLGAMEQKLADSARQSIDLLPAIHFALTSRLEQAVASGKPFAGTLEALRRTGVAAGDLAPFAAFATTGAPSAAQLKSQFLPLAQGMIVKERGRSGESVTDRLWRMSERVIRIRPRENANATDIVSVTNRIEAALDRGSFTAAADQWNSLPEPARQSSAEWGKRINDRANVTRALQSLGEKTVSALEASTK